MKIINKNKRASRRGSVLILVLLVAIVLSLTGIGLLQLSFQAQAQAIRASKDIEARFAADAGLTKALYEMNEKLKVKPWDDSTLPQATNESLVNCNATFSYTVTVDGGGVYSVSSVGLSGQAQRTVIATLRLKWLDYGFFAQNKMKIKSGSVVGWYNNIPSDGNFKLGTASVQSESISIESGATVNGDIAVGVGGSPNVVIKATGATITGKTYAMTDLLVLPSVIVPNGLQALPSQGTLTGSTTITGSAKYDSWNLAQGNVVTIDGPAVIYVAGKTSSNPASPVSGTPMSNKGRIVINDANPNASLTMYVGGKFRLDAIVNNTLDPKRVKFYCLDSCPEWEIRTDGIFYGIVYAPNSEVELKGSINVFGSIVARELKQKKTGSLNYDASLRDGAIGDPDVRFVTDRWSE